MKQFIISSNNFTLDMLKKNDNIFNEHHRLIKEINQNTDIFDYDKFKNDIKDYVKQIDYNNDEHYMDNIMYELLQSDSILYEILNKEEKENLWGECKLSYDLKDIRYEIIYIDPKVLQDKVKENHLGSLLTYEQIGIYGPCVIIGTKMSIENDEIKHEMVDIDISDIFKILVSRVIIQGLMIKENSVSNIFISSKKNILNDVNIKLFNDCIDKKVNGFTYFCYQNTISKDYVNIIATKLFNTTIYNDVIIFLEKDNIFLDINIDIFEKSLINSTIEFISDEKIIDYVMFLKAFNKKNNNCVCNKKIEKVYLCQKCYMQVYCSKECQKNNWLEHQNNC